MIRPSSRLFRVVVAAALCGLYARPAVAGRVEARADGTTVIHLEVWWLPKSSATHVYRRAERAAIDEFVKRFPKIFAARYRGRYKANPKVYGRYNWDNVALELHGFSWPHTPGKDAAVAALAEGRASDVLYVNFRGSEAYIRRDYLYPLDKPEDGYFGDLARAKITDKGIRRPRAVKGGMTDEELNFRVHPKIWPVIRRKGPRGRTHVWAIPWGGVVGKVLLYRKDLFDRRGIRYPDEKWTWDDMYEACKKITDPKKGVYGICLGRVVVLGDLPPVRRR